MRHYAAQAERGCYEQPTFLLLLLSIFNGDAVLMDIIFFIRHYAAQAPLSASEIPHGEIKDDGTPEV